MKKLSLKNAKSMLSRKEMKAINGGYTYGHVTYDVCMLACSSQPNNHGCTYINSGGFSGWFCSTSGTGW